MKFDDFMKKHGYPNICSLQKNKVNNRLVVRGEIDVHRTLNSPNTAVSMKTKKGVFEGVSWDMRFLGTNSTYGRCVVGYSQLSALGLSN